MIIATFVFALLSTKVITIFNVAQPINVATIVPSLQLQLYSLSLNALRWFSPYLFPLKLTVLISVFVPVLVAVNLKVKSCEEAQACLIRCV